MLKRSLVTILLFILSAAGGYAQIQLPKLVSDGMVLQRDAVVTIWGWASPGEELSVDFRGEQYQTTADEEGNWHVQLARYEQGGPFTMRIKASDTVTIENILIGDVWIASGQSNMELPMTRVKPLYQDQIQNADYPLIRYFDVPKDYDFKQSRTDFEYGEWQETNAETVRNFSATAYFFAKKLVETYEVPVGIIHAGLGGSPAEAWLSEKALKEFPEHYEEAQRFKDERLIEEIELEDQARIRAWYDLLNERDPGLSGENTNWYQKELQTNDWETISIPGYWADTELGPINGSVWFRKEITLSQDVAGKPAKLELGRIVDADSVFVNGTFVGTTSYQYPPRWYNVPENVLEEGTNTIAVRVINESGKGGFISDKPYELIAENDTIDLKGDWKYKTGAVMKPLEGQTFIRWKPVGLFNAMIYPLHQYKIRGVIWYQGESNTGNPEEYKELFPALIHDWRHQWGQGDFPFLFVQLTNFMEPVEEPSESNWALLREAQLQTLSLPNTGMATTIDIGEWNDIHPLNKKDVGERLARSAMKVAYGDDIVPSGPIYDSMQIDGNKIKLSFKHTGSGLTAKGGELQEFAIAGPDKEFVWANAKIEGDSIIVWSEEVKDPVAVRYAWADNPENANLYNKEDMPASPFRTE